MKTFLFSFHFRMVCRMFADGHEMNVKQVSSPDYSHVARIWCILVASHPAGRRSSVMATDLEGCLWDERENHHALDMNILHTICTELQKDYHPTPNPRKKNAAMQSWLHRVIETVMYNFSNEYSWGNILTLPWNWASNVTSSLKFTFSFHPTSSKPLSSFLNAANRRKEKTIRQWLYWHHLKNEQN